MNVYRYLHKIQIVYFLFFVVVISHVTISCKSKQESFENKTINVIFKDSESFIFSNFFEQIEFIPLETNEYNLFRKITDVNIVDDKLFVFSEAPDNMVNIFDSGGNHLETISNTGRGPGELNYATSFSVDSSIMILDRSNRKILKFGFDGKFTSEIYLNNLFFTRFATINNNNIVLFDYKPLKLEKGNSNLPKSKLTFWNYNDDKIKQIAYAPDLNSGKDIPIILKNFFSISNNDLYYWDVFNDTINKVDLKSYQTIAFQILNFGESKIPKHIFDNNFNTKINPKNLKQIVSKGYASLFDYFYCKNGTQLFVINRHNKMYIGILKDNENNLLTFNKISLDNLHESLDIKINFQNIYITHYDDQSAFYFGWEAMDFMKTFQKLKSQITPTEWKLMLDSNHSLMKALEKAKIDDNPILMKARIIQTK